MSSAVRENVKVAVRVRPRLAKEVASGSTECVEVDIAHNTVFTNKPTSKRPGSRIGIDDFGEIVRADPSQTQNYTFDIVLGTASTQEEVFFRCASDVVKSVISGYNGSIIASGQTSSGKTYTIEGTKDLPGVIPRAAELIFSQIGSSSIGAGQYLVRTSYLQIYNEKISDLLEPSRENLKIREDGCGGVFVEALTEHVVRNTEEVMSLIQQGARLRATNATRMNKESSRSHAVFTIIIEHANDDEHGGLLVTVGKLRLVDLAGSERLDVDAESRLQEETKNINVSLHNFSKVVTALTTPSVKHIPYRDSKLTRILQDCLGGNCKTTMIATITPVSECYSETMNTLKFAKRAKSIRNTAQVNQDMSEKAMISSYRSEIKRLKLQLEERSSDSSTDYMQLLRERKEAKREREEVISMLEVQQKLADEAKVEKFELVSKIKELEDKFLRGGSKAVMETDEFKQALLKEQQRVQQETANQYERKLAELEKEKERLESEKQRFEKQFKRLYSSGVPQRDQDTASPTFGSMPSLHRENEMFAQQTQHLGGTTVDPEAASALQEYVAALSHPHTGIPCQELVSGIKIFTGSTAAHWFIKNMEGVSSMQNAQVVGQRLIDLGAFIEIQGSKTFVVSKTSHYQFCIPSHPRRGRNSERQVMSQSLGSLAYPPARTTFSGISSRERSLSSSSVLSSSVASLHIQGDLLEHFGLTSSCPSEIHISCLYGERSKVKTLLFDKCGINSTDSNGRTSLMYAVIGKQTKCCMMLLRSGADVNFRDHSGHTALLLATKYEYEDVMRILLKSGAETHHTDTDGRTVFHLASSSQNYKCLEYLCRYGSPGGMNTRDNSYRTPLLYAVQAKLAGHVKRLLLAKADLGISDDQGRTALHYAVTCNSLPCAQAIVETNSNGINLIDTAGQSALHLACISGSSDIFYYLSNIPSCHINLQDDMGNTALHYAVRANRVDLIEVLLSKGASLTLKNQRHMTALQCSLEMGLDGCTKKLKKL